MNASTLVSPDNLAERDVAVFLEERYGAAWLPEYRRCSIETDDAFVAVDYDPEFAAHLPADERQTLVAEFGFVPKTALHVQESVYHAGSPRLAQAVLQALCQRFN